MSPQGTVKGIGMGGSLVSEASFPTPFLEVSILQWAQDTRFHLPMVTPSVLAAGHGWRAGQGGILLADLVQSQTSQDLTNKPTSISQKDAASPKETWALPCYNTEF